MGAVGLQFERLVGTQASILVFLSLLEIPLRDTRFFGVARGHSRGGHFHCYRRAGIAQSGPHQGGAAFSCRKCYNMSPERPVLSLSQLSLHFVRFRKVSQDGMVSQ